MDNTPYENGESDMSKDKNETVESESNVNDSKIDENTEDLDDKRERDENSPKEENVSRLDSSTSGEPSANESSSVETRKDSKPQENIEKQDRDVSKMKSEEEKSKTKDNSEKQPSSKKEEKQVSKLKLEIDSLKQQLKNLEEEKNKEISEWKNKYLYLQAELENTRKHYMKQQIVTKNRAKMNVITAFTPLIDSFEMALKSKEKILKECKAESVKIFLDGFEKIFKSFMNTFRSLNVKAIDQTGVPFDYKLHETIMQIENPDLPEDTVIQIVQKGFIMDGEVIRPAKVIVSKKPHKDDEEEASKTEKQNTEEKIEEKQKEKEDSSKKEKKENSTKNEN